MRGLPRTFWYLWSGMLVNRLGGFVFTFLALYLTQERHYTVAEAGVVVALYGVGSMGAGPVGGMLADRIGRRATMLLSMTLGGAAMLQLGFARTPLHIAFSTLLLGFFNDMYRPAVQATIADLVPPAERARAYGYMYWAINLGFAGAAMIAGVMANKSFLLLFLADAGTTLAFGVIVFLRVPETHPEPTAQRGRDRASLLTPFRDPIFLAFVGIQLMIALIFHQSTVALPLDLRAHGVEPRVFGILIGLNGLLIVLLQPIALRFIQRARRAQALALGALLTGVGFWMTGLTHAIPFYALSIVVWTLGEIVLSPVTPTVIADLSPVSLRGSYQGVFQMSWGVSSFAAPTIGSFVLGHFGGTTLWTGCLFMGVIAAFLHLAIAGPRRRRLVALGVTTRE
jgi:MFS family permease